MSHVIPEELISRKRWAVWEKTEEGKVPHQAFYPFNPASFTNPCDWSTHREALRAWGKNGDQSGVSFAVGYPYVVLDLDHCFKGDILHSAAAEIHEIMNSYTERSYSGDGLHIFVKGRLRDDDGCGRVATAPWHDKLEIHHQRWISMTGDPYPGASRPIMTRQNEIDVILSPYFPERQKRSTPSSPSDIDIETLLARCEKVYKDSWTALYEEEDTSEWDDDNSVADFHFVRMLVYCGASPELVDDVYRDSAIVRDKWDAPRREGTYGDNTNREGFSVVSVRLYDESMM